MASKYNVLINVTSREKFYVLQANNQHVAIFSKALFELLEIDHVRVLFAHHLGKVVGHFHVLGLPGHEHSNDGQHCNQRETKPDDE